MVQQMCMGDTRATNNNGEIPAAEHSLKHAEWEPIAWNPVPIENVFIWDPDRP